MNRQNYISKIVCFFGVLSFLAVSCKTNPSVSGIWNYVQERPDSALVVLETLPSASYKGRSLAEYRLLKAMALDKNYINVDSDSLARPAYEFFHRYGPKEKEMMSLYYLGVSQYYSKDYQQAIITLDRSLDMAKECHNNRYAGLSAIHKSYIYEADYNHTDAIRSAEESIPFFSTLPDSTHHVKLATMHLANCYLANRDYEWVCSLFKPILSAFPEDTVLQRRGLTSYAWAMYLSNNDKATDAVGLFEKAIENYHASLSIAQASHYVVVLVGSNRIGKARSILPLLENYQDNPDYVEYIWYAKYQLFKAEENFKEALAYYELLLARQNDIASSKMEQSIVRAQRDNEARLYQLETLANRRRTERFIFLLCFLCLIFSMLLYIHRKKRRETDLQRVQLLYETRELERQLFFSESSNKTIQAELEDTKQKYVSSFKKQFQKVSSLIEDYYLTSGSKNGRDYVYRQVMDLACSIGNDYESMRTLERSINKALDNAMSLFREEFPGKDASFYHMVCYFMAGFPATTIEILTGVNKNTIYTKKKRLLEEIVDSSVAHKELFLLAIK